MRIKEHDIFSAFETLVDEHCPNMFMAERQITATEDGFVLVAQFKFKSSGVDYARPSTPGAQEDDRDMGKKTTHEFGGSITIPDRHVAWPEGAVKR